ncbi:nose resistant to fluoxetine protein 6-like [Branchiostoma floridae x Branchiostoma japonicum]
MYLSLIVVDSGGKPGSGILNGNLIWAGSYSQCVNITKKGYNITFDGKFYMATVMPVVQSGPIAGLYGIRVGICVPSSCSQHDVIQSLDGGKLNCICGVIILLLTIGTIYDVIIHQPRLKAIERQKLNESEEQEPDVAVTSPDEGTPQVNRRSRKKTPAAKDGMTGRILLCFSLYTNIGKVLSTKQAPGSIKCLHGIRFISMTWVILAHTYLYAREFFDNWTQFEKDVETFTIQAINNASLCVDSFFFLSGLLMSYLLIKQLDKSKEKGKSVSYGMLYFHRYWRLTPTYMFVMMLWMWVLPYLFSGPFVPQAPYGLDDNCRDNWWTNLLYVNNVVNPDRMCMDWSWYLANDMQFFVIGVPLVYMMYRWQIFGIALQLALLLASFVITATITWHYDMIAPLGSNYYYHRPYCRIGPYLVGVAVGWLLVKIKRKRTKSITMRLLMTIGWLVAAASAMAVLYATYGQYHGTTLQTEAENVLYLTVHRTVWAMALGWVVVACHHGYGGVVDIILSWDAWVPLSRLTYCAYLVHLLLVFAVYISMEMPIHYTTFTMIYFFMGHLTISFGMAFLVSVAVEMPLVGLEKVIFNK